MLKKWIALLLSFVLMLSALPLGVFAETEPTDSTQPASTEATAPGETQETKPEETAEEEKKKIEITAQPVGAWGTVTPPQKLRTKVARILLLRDAIAWDYQNALFHEDAESLLGYCGLLASYQLFHRGINTWRKSADGNNHFDEYSAMNMTTGGYIPQAYAALEESEKPEEQPQEQTPPQTPEQTPEQTTAPGQEQVQEAPKGKSLEKVLNEITNHGTLDVYNLLVCFEKTDTAAGSIYGHVVFIYGIIDGILYFTESANLFGKQAGEPMECSISQFAASYDTWTEFEGVIVLGCKEYLENCAAYQSELFATCVEPTQLMALPYQENSQQLRSVRKGERLQVIGLYENREKEFYCQIDDGGTIGYVRAVDLLPILYLHDSFTLTEAKLPETLRPGRDFTLDGNVLAPGALLSQVCVQILDEEGNCLQKAIREATGEEFDLGNYQLNRALEFHKLEEGSYTCRIQADSVIYAYAEEKLVKQVDTQLLLEQSFCVAKEEKNDAETAEPVAAEVTPVQQPTEPTAAEEEPAKSGWYYENQTWYCYKQGAPCTGWVRSAGVDYYLKEDGSVTTGWAVVDGRQRLFTATGAIYSGWLKDQDGVRYLDENGVPVCGWHRIGGAYCSFDEKGFLQKKFMGSALRQLRQMGLTKEDLLAAEAAKNTEPQEE